jgi:hypothetical protein
VEITSQVHRLAILLILLDQDCGVIALIDISHSFFHPLGRHACHASQPHLTYEWRTVIRFNSPYQSAAVFEKVLTWSLNFVV